MLMSRPQDTQQIPSFEELLQSLGKQSLMNSQPVKGPSSGQIFRGDTLIQEPRQPLEAQDNSRIFWSSSSQDKHYLNRFPSPENRSVHSNPPNYYSSSPLSAAPPTLFEPPAVSAPCNVAPIPREDHVSLCADFNRIYACRTCGRSFTTSGHLARHNRIHTGERNHECPFPTCNARFARQDNCAQHYRTHLKGKNRKARRKKDNHRAQV